MVGILNMLNIPGHKTNVQPFIVYFLILTGILSTPVISQDIGSIKPYPDLSKKVNKSIIGDKSIHLPEITPSNVVMPKDWKGSPTGGIKAGTSDNKGTEFWLVMERNYDLVQSEISLSISGEFPTSGYVEIPGLAFNQAFSLEAGQTVEIYLPAETQVETSEIIEDKGIHVVADEPVTVQGINHKEYSTDGYLGLPVDVLGDEYMVMSYMGFAYEKNVSQFVIVSPSDNVTVYITPSCETREGLPAGTTFQVILNQGDTYQVQSSLTSSACLDFTGSTIQSTSPVAVFSGNACTTVPDQTTAACDHLIEQLPPVSDWGTSFLTQPLSGRDNGDTWRILAASDGTLISIDGVSTTTLNFGEYYTFNLETAAEIASSQPVLIMQFANGTEWDDLPGDPFMLFVQPTSHYANNLFLNTPEQGFPDNYINVVTPTSGISTLFLDFQLVDPSWFSPIGSSTYSAASIAVEPGGHLLFNTQHETFCATGYGFSTYDSYGYNAGYSNSYSIPEIAPVADFNADQTWIIPGNTIQFNDRSLLFPTSWEWSFTGPASVTFANGTDAFTQNPEVTFPELGNYSVTLTATNAFGSTAKTKEYYIKVLSNTYCTASGGGLYHGYISGVELGTISNTGTGSNLYRDYTELSTELIRGQNNVPITITNGNPKDFDDLAVWIDWNHDGSFDDTYEQVVCETNNYGQGSFTFNVPLNAVADKTIMRVRIFSSGSSCNDANPCGDDLNGEVEDYMIDIIDDPAYQYCGATGGGTEYISSVTISNLDNTGTADDGYTLYEDLFADLSSGSTEEITITNGNPSPSGTTDLGVWIDWNGDRDFNDVGENVVCDLNNGGQGTFPITIPEDAFDALTIMRVIIKDDDEGCSPCGTFAIGEVEDYYIRLNPYCQAAGESGGYYLSQVFYGTEALGYANSWGTGDDGYTEYPDVVLDISPGMDFKVNILKGGTKTLSDDYAVWADFNQDGDFDDLNEEIVCITDQNYNVSEWASVPADALFGLTRMRVRHKVDPVGCGEPCGIALTGEVEDYFLNITILPPSAGFSADNLIPQVGETVSFTDNTLFTPTSWTWEFDPPTVTYVGGTDANSQDPQVTFDSPGAYQVTLTVSNAGGIDDEIKTSYIHAGTPGLWTGEFTSQWAEVLNWENHLTPTASNAVTIPASAFNWPEFDGNMTIGATCGDIELLGESQLIINGNLTIQEGKSMDCGQGTLLVSGNWTNTGTFTNGTGTIDLSGNLNIQEGSNFYCGQGTFLIGGNWSNLGSFHAETGTVEFYGDTPSSISGPLLQENAFSDGFETPTGWVLSGEFEIDSPNGLIPANTYSEPDPGTAFDGANVLGVDLTGLGSKNGYYESSISLNEYEAISPSINCTGATGLSLNFQRWLGVEHSNYDNAYIYISDNNGSSWTELWNNGGTIDDGEWVEISLDISSYADNQADIKIKFTMGPSDGSIEYCGWNIDNLAISSIYPGPESFSNLVINKQNDAVVSLTSGAVIAGDLQVKEGIMDLNGQKLECGGSLDINSNATLAIDEQATLDMSDLNTLTVKPGGTLQVLGTAGNEAVITSSSGNYTLKVQNGGILSAAFGIFEKMDAEGICLLEGALVDPAYAFDNCTIHLGASGGNLLTVYNNINFQADDVLFPTNTWGGTYNVYKYGSAGNIIFVGATGGFAGESYEYDPGSNVHWNSSANNFTLDLTVFLEGPFNPGTNLMETALEPFIPLDQPFNPALPYLGNASPVWLYGGFESAVSIPVNTVDWVLLELRDAATVASATPATVLTTRPAFLRNDGQVVDLDGSSPITFNANISNGLFVVVWHRNHVGMISAGPLAESAGSYTFDFSSGETQAYGGTSAQKNLSVSPEIWGALSGDGDADGQVSNTDLDNVWDIQAGEEGYFGGDFNLNSQTDNTDKDDYWLPNNGEGSVIPD